MSRAWTFTLVIIYAQLLKPAYTKQNNDDSYGSSLDNQRASDNQEPIVIKYISYQDPYEKLSLKHQQSHVKDYSKHPYMNMDYEDIQLPFVTPEPQVGEYKRYQFLDDSEFRKNQKLYMNDEEQYVEVDEKPPIERYNKYHDLTEERFELKRRPRPACYQRYAEYNKCQKCSDLCPSLKNRGYCDNFRWYEMCNSCGCLDWWFYDMDHDMCVTSWVCRNCVNNRKRPNYAPGCNPCSNSCYGVTKQSSRCAPECWDRYTSCMCINGFVWDQETRDCVKSAACYCDGDPKARPGCQEYALTCRGANGWNESNLTPCDNSKPGCKCTPGFVKDYIIQKCVLQKDCVCNASDLNTVYGCPECLETCVNRELTNSCKANCIMDSCICKNDYILDTEKDKCVPAMDCPCNGDLNAFYGCADCTRYCSEITRIEIDAVCKAKCLEPKLKGCVCRKGYLMDDGPGICIPFEDCPCGGDYNATLGCLVGSPKTCENYFDDASYGTGKKSCKVCICREGYVHDEQTKKCEPRDDCACDGDPNAMIGCQDCALTCNVLHNVTEPDCVPCDDNHPSRCKCRDGYARDYTRAVCSELKNCSCNGDPHAIFGCSECLKTCDHMYDPLEDCREGCSVDTCICRDGYFNNTPINKCVIADACPFGDDPNATPGCLNCALTCNALWNKPETSCPRCFDNSTAGKCKVGYAKDFTRDLCVTREDCSCDGDPNAVFGCYECLKRCDRMYDPLENCTEGCSVDTCICRAEYFNNTKINKCVEADACPGGDDPNSTPGCQNCSLTCNVRQGIPEPRCPYCNDNSTAIKCKIGLLKDYTRDLCVQPEDCSCNEDPNAIFGCSACFKICDRMYDPLEDCIEGCSVDTCICRGQLYSDTKINKCVEADECPAGDDLYATRGCQNCDLTCNVHQGLSEPRCPECTDNSTAIKCKIGFVKDYTRDMCVKPEDCSCNGDPNAIIGCSACLKKCDRMYDPLEACREGCSVDTCICRDGYFNDTKINKCVEADGCPSGDDPYATPGCQDCTLTCDAHQGLNDTRCPECTDNSTASKCKIGFLKDYTRDKCVSSEDCSCNGDPHAIFGCSPCSKKCNRMFDPLKDCTAGCIVDICICRDGYFNDTDRSVCVEADECPWGDDPYATPGCLHCNLTCNVHQGLTEPRCTECTDNSTASKCKVGFVKDYTRDMCVRPEDCSCNGDPNAMIGCNACLKRCERMYDPLDDCIEGCSVDTCVCRDEYFNYTKINECVEADACPFGDDPHATPGCLDCALTCNAMWNKPETACPTCVDNSTAGRCKVGYAKDITRDICVSPDDCSCDGDPNAIFGCSECLKRCDHMYDLLEDCREGCSVDTCICRVEYYNDTTINKCVEADECPGGDDPYATPGCQKCSLTCNSIQGVPEPRCPECTDNSTAFKCKIGFMKDYTRDTCVKPEDCSCNDDPNAIIGCNACLKRCDRMYDPLEDCIEGCSVDTCVCRDDYFNDTNIKKCVEADGCPYGDVPNATPGCQDCSLTCNVHQGLHEPLSAECTEMLCEFCLKAVAPTAYGDVPNATPGCQDCSLTCNVHQVLLEPLCAVCTDNSTAFKCKIGFVKDYIRDLCVRPEDCSCNRDPNAIIGCNSCLKRCDRMYDLLENCREGCSVDTCICRDDYFNYTKENKCVEPNSCPCDPDPNATPGCQECDLTCNVHQNQLEPRCTECTDNSTACKCKIGFLKDYTRDVCATPDDCSCNGDPNAITGCSECLKRCDRMYDPLESCREGCSVDTCICRDRYFNDTTINKCVEADDCPYSDIPNATPGCQDCSITCNVHQGLSEPRCTECTDNSTAFKCRIGFVKDYTRDGMCVKLEDCSCNGDPNAIMACYPCLKTCDRMYDSLEDCREGCYVDTCVCRDDYFNDTRITKCVESDECPCDPDLHATPGCQDCDLTCNALWNQPETACSPCDDNSTACKCKIGYAKDITRNICVSPDDCSCDGDSNAIFGCSACLKRCDRMYDPLEDCRGGCSVDTCICRDDYFNDTVINECVVADACPSGDDPYATPGCQLCSLTCNVHQGLSEPRCTECTDNSTASKCKIGFVKDYTRDKCVRPEDCSCDGDPNAIIGCSACSKKCYVMYDLLRKCRKGCSRDTCICRDGYYKETLSKKCVVSDDCPCYPDPNATPGCQNCELTCNALQDKLETNCLPCDNNSTACKCKVGFVKDYTRGMCVRPADCSCNRDPNARLGCSVCKKNCLQMFKLLNNCTEGCTVDSCICKHGYFYDNSQSKCVEAEECPCGIDLNSTPGCQDCKLTCNAVQNKPETNCTVCDDDSTACKCKCGYVKDITRDMCVSRDDCSCDGDPNTIYGCSGCSARCDRMHAPLNNCIKGCTADACICRKGFYYHKKNNKCTESDDCPCGPDPHATPGCQDCALTCSALHGQPELNCPPCESEATACKCKVGYVKDTRRKMCVKLEDCSCGSDLNAVYGCQDCKETCSAVYDKPNTRCKPCINKKSDCKCKNEFVKDITRDICVKKEDCSCDGDPSAIYGCSACEKNCARMFHPLKNCTEGCSVDICICRRGYFRDSDKSKCVKSEDCPCGTDPNSTPGCQDCNLTCNAQFSQSKSNCAPCDSIDPGCRCKDGYLMDTLTNMCVRHKHCSCGSDPNTVHGCQDCGQTCYALNNEPDPGACAPCHLDSSGCKCKVGYVKDTVRDMCVLHQDCTCNGDSNAVVGCIHCLVKCETMFVPSDKNCSRRCHKERALDYCICRAGYYLDTGRMTCVKAEECPCGDDPNATPGCQDCEKTCNALWDVIRDICHPCDNIRPGCKCRSGYVKDTVREMCVKSNHCTCNGDMNAVVGCAECLRECDAMFEALDDCIKGCKVDTCICHDGYYMDAVTSKCVESNDCSCGPDPHATPGCQDCALTCGALHDQQGAACPPCDRYNPGCKCKDGYVKDTRWDMCVKTNECSCNDDPHSVHGCQDCELTCDALNADVDIKRCPHCDSKNPGCKCGAGYVMDMMMDKCVRRGDCSCNSDPNAVVGCIRCLIECDAAMVPRVRNCQDMCTADYAFDYCVCREGYYLNAKKGECVKVEQCPCGTDPHATPGCQDCALTCNAAHGNTETNCTQCNRTKPMCMCQDGYVKDTTRDKCVRKNDCSCNGDPNAVYGCSVCSKTCARMFSPLKRCTKGCPVDACVCRDGYFNDTVKNKCVKAENCSCGKDPHATPGCQDCKLTCNAQFGERKTNCSACDRSNPGCKCKRGYVKDSRKDICVTRDYCSCGPDPNAVHGCQDCAQTCDALTGQNETRCTPCDTKDPGCKCKPGYVKDNRRNLCVLRQDCYDHKASMRMKRWLAPIIGLSLAGGMFMFGAIFTWLWFWLHAMKPTVPLPVSSPSEDLEVPSSSSCQSYCTAQTSSSSCQCKYSAEMSSSCQCKYSAETSSSSCQCKYSAERSSSSSEFIYVQQTPSTNDDYEDLEPRSSSSCECKDGEETSSSS